MNEINKTEVLLREKDKWLYFSDPHRIITVTQLDEVQPALREIERLIELNGWHAAGFLSYESAPAFDKAFPSMPTTGFPYLWFGLYPEPRSVDIPAPRHPKEILDWHPTVDRDTYNAAIAQIKEYIAHGRTYQVNYTMCLQSDSTQAHGISSLISRKTRTITLHI